MRWLLRLFRLRQLPGYGDHVIWHGRVYFVRSIAWEQTGNPMTERIVVELQP